MRSEAKKRYTDGFNLTEQELRRIHGTIIQQLEKVSNGNAITQNLEIKFKNGVIANPSSIDEILELENIGAGLILRLYIKMEIIDQDKNSSIKLEFNDIDSDPGTDYDSIAYTVLGDDRDWVFITGSEIDERLTRVKKVVPNSLLGKFSGPRKLFRYLIALIAGIGVSIPFLMTLTSNWATRYDDRLEQLDLIQSRWENGELSDTVEVLIELQRHEILSYKSQFSSNEYLLTTLSPFFLYFGFLVVFIIIYMAWAYFSPAYNFLWGEFLTGL